MDVIVVGAGVAGLAAAYALTSVGLDCVVLEKASFTGGRMSSEVVDGFVIDRGAYTLSAYATRTRTLAEEVGCAAAFARLTTWAGAFRGGRVHEYRSDCLPWMAFGSGLTPREAGLAARLLQRATTEQSHLRLHKPDERTLTLDAESTSECIMRATKGFGASAGSGVVEKVAYPLVSALYISDPERTSAAAFLASLRYMSGLRLYNSSLGLGVLCDQLAARVIVRTGVTVTRVRAAGQGVEAEAVNTSSAGASAGGHHVLEARSLICTAPAPDALRILADLSDECRHHLRQVHYTSNTPVALGLTSPVSGRAFTVSVPRSAGFCLATVTNECCKHAARVPEGRGLLMAYPTAEAGTRFLEADDESVVRRVVRDVEAVYPGSSRLFRWGRVYRWPLACSQLRPGDVRNRALLRSALPQSGPVFLAGDYLASSSSIEGSLVSGLTAARKAQSYLSARAGAS